MSTQPAIGIRPEWDAALTYDDLAPKPGSSVGPIFVGREDLLDVIVGAIRQPDRRGTFLVSGYRGAGKTTLLIEAIRRTARLAPFTTDWKLMPLVLNASEVSAALPALASAATPSVSPGGAPLQIGPQQLLTALIRTLRNAAEAPATPLPEHLKTQIQDTYRKAMAKEYSRSEGTQTQQTRTLTRELEVKLSTADTYKNLGLGTAGAALVVEGSALFASWAAALHTLAATLAGLAVLSWTASRKLSTVAKQESNEAVAVKFDNSLQQLETDLKEILGALHADRRRVVVVLEELDKLRDEDGQQLDAVIRYFKNLFTQAPALFFFVTDKGYYDFIAGEIRRARRQRSYAIQHTFFTHRLFVGRPTTRDCLAYLKSILADDEAGKKLDRLYASAGLAPFAAEIGTDPLLRLVRHLLFRASNHLFDLKNELRRFVSNSGSSTYVLNTGALGDDDVAAGVFQDLIVQKYALFSFSDSRPYVNEVLNDCLHAIFTDLGSDTQQRVADYYPRALMNAGTSPPMKPLPSEDQLELAEQQRIRAAVDSVIEDLQRGGAFETEKTNIMDGYFVWKRTAAQAFRFVRRLERHETIVLEHLDAIRARIAPFMTGGALATRAGITADADAFVNDVENARQQIQTTDQTMSVDDTDKELLRVQQRAAEEMAKAYRARLHVVERYGFRLSQIANSVDGGTLFALEGAHGNRRYASGRGAVLLACGEGGRLEDDVREFVVKMSLLRRLVVLHVVDTTGDHTALTARAEGWRRLLASRGMCQRL